MGHVCEGCGHDEGKCIRDRCIAETIEACAKHLRDEAAYLATRPEAASVAGHIEQAAINMVEGLRAGTPDSPSFPTDAAVVLRENFQPDIEAARAMYEKTKALLDAMKMDRSSSDNGCCEAAYYEGRKQAAEDARIEMEQRLLASTAPDGGAIIRKLEDELHAKELELSELRKALAFYAEPATYSNMLPGHPGKTFSRPIEYDVDEQGQGGALWAAGSRARRALRRLASAKP